MKVIGVDNGAVTSADQFEMDDLAVSATGRVVPLPASSLAGLAVLGSLAVCRRRSRAAQVS